MSGYARITFLSDYGHQDGFVAACHGVIARIAPEARVVDVAHTQGDMAHAGHEIALAARVLAQTLPCFPPSVHLAIVDPGVGTARRGIAVRAGEHVLVGPDNGLLMEAAEALSDGPLEARELTNTQLMLDRVSSTFHGRDVFAPVAAHLMNGVPFADVGPVVTDPVRLPEPVAVVDAAAGRARAEVIGTDWFGNLQLALTRAQGEALLGGWSGAFVTLEPGGRSLRAGRTFADVESGDLVLFPDSAGHVAIAVNGDHADVELNLSVGDVVELIRGAAGDLDEIDDEPDELG